MELELADESVSVCIISKKNPNPDAEKGSILLLFLGQLSISWKALLASAPSLCICVRMLGYIAGNGVEWSQLVLERRLRQSKEDREKQSGRKRQTGY